MQIRFNSLKATQAACYLIKRAGGAINYTILLKLLYLADRQALDKYGTTVTTDAAFAMKSGMVLTHTYNLIRNIVHDQKTLKRWTKFVSAPIGTKIKLLREAPTDELSQVELGLLDEVFEKYAALGLKLIDVHHKLPEWKDPGTSSIPISVNEILAALGKTKEQIYDIEVDLELSNLHAQLSANE